MACRAKVVWVTPMNGKPKGKPKTPPTVQEQETIVTLAASGLSQNKIAQTVGRSRHMVKNVMAEPEIQCAIKDEKAELAAIYREKARDVVASISDGDISKASLQQKAISSGVLLDKSLLLSGEPTSVNSIVLLDIAEAIKLRDQLESERQFRQAHAQLTAPAPET
jgi:predicted DNA-binding protein (UPF0251 family)